MFLTRKTNEGATASFGEFLTGYFTVSLLSLWKVSAFVREFLVETSMKVGKSERVSSWVVS